MKRSWLALAALAIVGIGLATVVRAETPSKAPADKKESLELRFAKAKLMLAELSLKRAEQLNAKVSDTVPASVMVEFRRVVDLEKGRLKVIAAGTADADMEYWLSHVQAMSREAQASFERSSAANKTVAGAVDQLDVDRMRVRAEIYQLLYEQGQQVAKKSATDRLSWQNKVLLTEVETLNGDVFRNRMLSGDHN